MAIIGGRRRKSKCKNGKGAVGGKSRRKSKSGSKKSKKSRRRSRKTM